MKNFVKNNELIFLSAELVLSQVGDPSSVFKKKF
jgi:hypothetical protein